MTFIVLDHENIESEHICCAISDKKCTDSYEQKKQWLRGEFDNGYIFQRLDERAKVFLEYGPAEKSWLPVTAENYMMLGCFWVSGKYKKQGYGKKLLAEAIKQAKSQGMQGLVSVAGTKKYHFMSDLKWFLKQGFEVREKTTSGFSLVTLDFHSNGPAPKFNECVISGECDVQNGCVVYYSNRCPYSEYHVQNSLVETCAKRNLPLTVIKLETRDQARSAPSPATIFSLFLNGRFVTTDISVCMDSRFDKVVKKAGQ